MSLDVESLVLARCASDPQRIALRNGSQSVRYGELRDAIYVVSRQLLAAGVRSGDCVAVLTEQPVDAIVSFLGVMNVGAAYLPLDGNLPSDRQQHLLETAKVRCCVVPQATAHDLPVETIEFGSTVDVPEKNPVGSSMYPPTDPAYVIFTSGSTGRPKGVAVSRGNLAYSTQVRDEFYREPVERFFLVSPLTFDSSVAGIYWTLSRGGTVILPDGPVIDASGVRAAIETEGVTHLLCIPSLWNLLLEKSTVGQLATLETVIVAGEACSRGLAARHHQLLPAARLYNEYGPTEATVWCSAHEVLKADASDTVPIGKAIPGSTIHLLDERQQPVGEGVEGEIYVSGPGVAIGYVGDPVRTSERFLPDPFASKPTRMYRTGDFGRLRSDGNIIYAGRRDGQVKVRGHRIEIEEVEGVLSEHPEIKEAAVAAWEHSAGSSLVSFVVPVNGHCPGSNELKTFAAARLPSYMLPQRSVRCDVLPRTRHGKIDRGQLIRLASNDAKRGRTSPPGESTLVDKTHRDLVRMWQGLLGHSRVGLDDCFFELGGDSLGAMQLVAHVERRWNVRVELSQLLTSPTIRSLGRLLSGPPAESQHRCLVPIQPQGTKPPLFCVHPGGGNVVCYLPLARELGADQPLYAFRALGVEAGETPMKTVEEMAAEYVRQMRSVQPVGPYAIAGWSFGGIVSYEMAQQLRRAGEELSFVGVIDGSPIYSIAVLREIFPDSQIPITQMNEQLIDQYFEPFYNSAADAMLVPRGASREHTYRVLRLFASTMRAAVDYRAKPLDTKMTLIVAEQKIGNTKYGPFRDWSRSCETIELHHVPGNHVDMMQSPHVSELAGKLTELLGNVDQSVAAR